MYIVYKGLVLMVFRRVRKIAKSDNELRNVRPSVRMERGSHWTDVIKFYI
jgi:hypothetical protein